MLCAMPLRSLYQDWRIFLQLFLGRMSADCPQSCSAQCHSPSWGCQLPRVGLGFSLPTRATQKDHPSFSAPHGVTLGLGLHHYFFPLPTPPCFLPSPCLPIHRFSSQGHFLINYLHADFHLRVCSLGNPTYNLLLPFFLSF